MKKKTVAVTSIGCRINTFEAEALRASLENRGWQTVSFDEAAEVYIINSCTVTARSSFKSRNLARKTARRHPQAKIVVTGCYAQQDWRTLQDMPEVSLVIGNTHKEQIPFYLDEWLNGKDEVYTSQIKEISKFQAFPNINFSEHTRAFLKIQDGCQQYCSYCIIPYVRGNYRSWPPEKIIAQIHQLVEAGFQEAILSGIHLGKYGIDLSPSISLTQLLQRIEAETALPRLRLSSLEPMDIDDDFIEFIAHSHIFCPHLHIPIQAANDRILKLMNRPYSVAEFANMLNRIRQKRPDILLGTDMIAGFPGETDADFDEALQNLTSLPISLFHIFPYSDRPGTAAFKQQPKVPKPVIKKRVRLLMEYAHQKRLELFEQLCNEPRPLKILLERQNNGYWQGFSENYLPCYWQGSGKINQIIDGQPKTIYQQDNDLGLLITRLEEDLYA